MSDHTYPREEVEAAWRAIVAAGDAGDWDLWADLHSEDCEWHECNYGVIKGRAAIKAKIKELMAPVPMMEFPVEWYLIEGNRVVFYPWQVFPDPKGGDEVYRFGCVTIFEYAGNGVFSRQEDIYNPQQGEAVVIRWLTDGGQLAADPSALGISSELP